jgi:hypothetical protein
MIIKNPKISQSIAEKLKIDLGIEDAEIDSPLSDVIKELSDDSLEIETGLVDTDVEVAFTEDLEAQQEQLLADLASGEAELGGILNLKDPQQRRQIFGTFRFAGRKSVLLNSGSVAQLGALDVARRGIDTRSLAIANLDDPIRRDMLKYWLFVPGQESALAIADQLVDSSNIPFSSIEFEEPVAYTELNNAHVSSSFPVITQRIKVSANRNDSRFRLQLKAGEEMFDRTKWEAFIASYIPEVLHQDMLDTVYEIQQPYDASGVGTGSNVPGRLWANAEGFYNFEDATYESKTPAIPESLIPNLLYMNDETINDAAWRILSQNFVLPINSIPINSPLIEKANALKKLRTYLRQYVQSFQESEITSELQQQGSNVIILPNVNLSSVNQAKRNFPMVVETSFNTDRATEFTEFLAQNELSEELFFNDFEELVTSDQRKHFFRFDVNIYDNEILEKKEENLFTFDVLNWALNYGDGYDKGLINQNAIVLGEETNLSAFARAIRGSIMMQNLRQYVANNLRTIEETFNGVKCANEAFVYRITKHQKFNDGSYDPNPLQSFFLFNDNETDIHELVDSQVKYDKEYLFKISAHQIVVGSLYRYYNIASATNPAFATAVFDVLIRPLVHIVETPIYEEEVIILDRPPLAPDVSISTFLDNRNKVVFRFQPGSGEITMKPVPINADDDLMVEKFARAQKVNPRGPITFATDDFVQEYEIYRLGFAPRSIQDFDGRLIKTLNVEGESDAWADRIIPNYLFYYLFRAKDSHGHTSNPSAVFQVEIVNDDGAIYPNIDVYQFPTPPKVMRKDVQKFIRILPSLPQSILNRRRSALKGRQTAKGVTPVLGTQQDSIFGKKIKLRFRSKHSGKCFDVNFRFDLNHLGEQEQ